MRWSLLVLPALLLAGLALPALASEGNRIGYVSFDEVRIGLENERARIEVDYTLDPGMGLIIILFGGADLEKKVERSLNFPAARVAEVGLSHAVFTVDHAAENYGGRAYWFPAHSFGVTFPRVRVEAPGFSLYFAGTRVIPRDFGYFGDMP
jgi:hypothetical protein